MQELSLHILDIMQNSIKAESTQIVVDIFVSNLENILKIKIKDNGSGIDEKLLKDIYSPFSTTRTTRKVGLGVSLFKMAALQCGGDLKIESQLGVGTELICIFKLNHIDRMPLGDLASTLSLCIMSNPEIDFILIVKGIYENETCDFKFELSEIKAQLGEVEVNNIEVVNWINEYIKENIKFLDKFNL